MADYSKDAREALATIKAEGKSFVISRPVVAFDAVGVPTDGETLQGNIFAIVLPRYKGMIFNSLDDSLKDALVKGKLKSVLAAAEGAPFKPSPLDSIEIAGSQWLVIGCTELAPDGETPIIYTIGVVERAFVPTPAP
jgi:hypothetical protein